MKLNLKVEWIKKLKSKCSGDFKWASDDQRRDIEIESLEPQDLDTLLTLMQANKGMKGTLAVSQKITTYRKLLLSADGVKITKLEPLVMAIKMLLSPTPHRWLFTDSDDGHIVPWCVYDIVYHASDARNGCPACVVVKMAAVVRGAKKDSSIQFNAHELGSTAYELLRRKGYYTETLEAFKSYVADNARYKEICGLTGKQFLAVGKALDSDNEWSSHVLTMECDGVASRVVMDDQLEQSRSSNKRDTHVTSSFWDSKSDGTDKEESAVDLPLQPYVRVFDLVKHSFVNIHVNNLTEYQYNNTLIDKLVLPSDKKDLVSMLVEGANLAMEDIVQGKTGGIIVICTGEPGTGKTLTSEVFSEQVKRPLYCVQCSQLGTDEKTLEKELSAVLARAQRWQAILLIDEADVYVHERGNDIQQNAIVGVFLRVLEYYKGVLFMTSNRETIIDDAIMSRATAWIKYGLPDKEELTEIWRVLSCQYKVELSLHDISLLVSHEKLTNVSGRSVKNLLKLSRLLAAKTCKPVTVDSIVYVSQFLDI